MKDPTKSGFERRLGDKPDEVLWIEDKAIAEGRAVLFDPEIRELIEINNLPDPYGGRVIGFVRWDALDNVKGKLDVPWLSDFEIENISESWDRWIEEGTPSPRTLDKDWVEGIGAAAEAIVRGSFDLSRLRNPVIFLDQRQTHRLKELKQDTKAKDIRLSKSPQKALENFLLEVGMGHLLGPREWKPRIR